MASQIDLVNEGYPNIIPMMEKTTPTLTRFHREPRDITIKILALAGTAGIARMALTCKNWEYTISRYTLYLRRNLYLRSMVVEEARQDWIETEGHSRYAIKSLTMLLKAKHEPGLETERRFMELQLNIVNLMYRHLGKRPSLGICYGALMEIRDCQDSLPASVQKTIKSLEHDTFKNTLLIGIKMVELIRLGWNDKISQEWIKRIFSWITSKIRIQEHLILLEAAIRRGEISFPHQMYKALRSSMEVENRKYILITMRQNFIRLFHLLEVAEMGGEEHQESWNIKPNRALLKKGKKKTVSEHIRTLYYYIQMKPLTAEEWPRFYEWLKKWHDNKTRGLKSLGGMEPRDDWKLFMFCMGDLLRSEHCRLDKGEPEKWVKFLNWATKKNLQQSCLDAFFSMTDGVLRHVSSNNKKLPLDTIAKYVWTDTPVFSGTNQCCNTRACVIRISRVFLEMGLPDYDAEHLVSILTRNDITGRGNVIEEFNLTLIKTYLEEAGRILLKIGPIEDDKSERSLYGISDEEFRKFRNSRLKRSFKEIWELLNEFIADTSYGQEVNKAAANFIQCVIRSGWIKQLERHEIELLFHDLLYEVHEGRKELLAPLKMLREKFKPETLNLKPTNKLRFQWGFMFPRIYTSTSCFPSTVLAGTLNDREFRREIYKKAMSLVYQCRFTAKEAIRWLAFWELEGENYWRLYQESRTLESCVTAATGFPAFDLRYHIFGDSDSHDRWTEFAERIRKPRISSWEDKVSAIMGFRFLLESDFRFYAKRHGGIEEAEFENRIISLMAQLAAAGGYPAKQKFAEVMRDFYKKAESDSNYSLLILNGACELGNLRYGRRTECDVIDSMLAIGFGEKSELSDKVRQKIIPTYISNTLIPRPLEYLIGRLLNLQQTNKNEDLREPITVAIDLAKDRLQAILQSHTPKIENR